MLTERGEVKIVDFGLAKLAGRTKLIKSGTTIGTVAYMSPEQSRGEDVDFRTDVWSLCILLYEMITGQLPFKGDYDQAVMYAIMNEVPEPMTALRTGVPMELERIVNKALAKRTDERYHTVGDILVDLNNIRKTFDESGKSKLSGIKESHFKKRFNKAFIPVVLLFILVSTLMEIWIKPYQNMRS